jgi:thiol-disulfide isomerase/thioredoxin
MKTHQQNPMLKVTLGILLTVLVGCSQHPASVAESKSASNAGQIGSRLPDFLVRDLSGHELSSADLKGKVVLVDFWATWCQPCKKEMPGYQKLLDQYGPRGFAVVGFKATMMMDTEDPLRFAQEVGVRYPLAIATPGITERFGGLLGLPTTLIFGREGVLRQKIIGFEYTSVVETEIKSLLSAN